MHRSDNPVAVVKRVPTAHLVLSRFEKRELFPKTCREERIRMKSTLRDSRLVAGFSRRSFFGRAAVASSAVLLGSGIPGKVRAEEKEGTGEGSPCGLPGVCDFPVPIPHINTPPPGGAHFYFPGPVSGAAAPTDPSGAHPEGRDPSPIFNFK